MPRSSRAKKTLADDASEPNVPISVRFPAELRTRTERFALEHRVALATAIRMIVGDHLDELEMEKGLSRAELWQRSQAWSTARSIVDGTAKEATWGELRSAHAFALKRGRARSAAR